MTPASTTQNPVFNFAASEKKRRSNWLFLVVLFIMVAVCLILTYALA